MQLHNWFISAQRDPDLPPTGWCERFLGVRSSTASATLIAVRNLLRNLDVYEDYGLITEPADRFVDYGSITEPDDLSGL